MSTTSSPAHSQPEPIGARLRHVAIGALFALVLLVPRILHLRRNANSWIFFRLLLGAAGAVLVVFPLGLWNSYLLAVLGLAMFIGAILLPPAKPETNADDIARELQALVVVYGGRYQPENAPSAMVQLFVGVARISVLDARFHPLLVIPVNEIIAAQAEDSVGEWLLRIRWAGHTAEFAYRGVFAEHLARVAETTLQSVIHPSLPVISRSRAAGA
jgi:hypothetical protein